jgi:hypothetical protein
MRIVADGRSAYALPALNHSGTEVGEKGVGTVCRPPSSLPPFLDFLLKAVRARVAERVVLAAVLFTPSPLSFSLTSAM